jgi:hypothetical protein
MGSLTRALQDFEALVQVVEVLLELFADQQEE